MFEGESERKENATYYNPRYSGEIGLTGESPPGEPSTSGSAQEDHSYREEDDEDSSAETHYASFYGSPPGNRGTECDDNDNDSAVEGYYADPYTNPYEYWDGETDDDDGRSSGHPYYGGINYGSNVTRAEEERSYDDDLYDYNTFYSTPSQRGGNHSNNDGGSSGHSNGGATSSGNATESADNERNDSARAFYERLKHMERWTLYDHCEIIASPIFTTPTSALNNRVDPCLVGRPRLEKAATSKEECTAMCQNRPHSSVNTSCIASMWWSKEAICEGLLLAQVITNFTCGLP